MQGGASRARVLVHSNVIVLAGIACLFFFLSGDKTISTNIEQFAHTTNPEREFRPLSSADVNISATSGRTFSMSRRHEYTGTSFTQKVKEAKPNPLQPIDKKCDRWAVMTTIFSPSQAALDVLGLEGWCLVVVGDKKSVPYAVNGTQGHLVFLSAEHQMKLPYRIVQLLPWNHFGRKNVGYLYAIHHGAQVIYDFDDDNFLLDGAKKASPLINPSTDKARLVYPDTAAWNPYPYYTKQAATWPRGFPLTMLDDSRSSEVSEPLPKVPAFDGKRLAVLQSLANHDPDVDAIYRLTALPLPFDFTEHLDELPLAPAPRFSMMPYNAQATLHFQPAFFGLFLPVTVHGRVSDIWRSYFTQRALWEADLAVAISPPWVKQIRNAHNYLADFSSEQDLYEKSDALVRYLVKEWQPEAAAAVDLGTVLAALYVDMFEHDIIGMDDVTLLQAWLLDLQDVGYDAPAVTHYLQRPPRFPDLQLYVRMFSKYGDEYGEKLFQSLDFFWPSHDLLVVLDSEREDDRKLGPQLLVPGVTVAYSEPTPVCDGKDRMQYDMLNADKLTSSTFVGFVDTDTVFVTQVLPDDLFDGDKPRVVGVLGLPNYGAGDWRDVPLATEFMLNKTEVFRGMSYFPVVIKTQHLIQLRQYVEKVHGKPFDDVFREMLGNYPQRFSQFNIMMNYLWYFHSDEYTFHLELADGSNPPKGIRVNITEAGVTPEMLQPFIKVATHWDYRVKGPSSVEPLDLAPALLEGYCLSYGYIGTPELCSAVPIVDVQDYMFNFEGHHWMFDMDGCRQAHKAHYDRVARYWNSWNATTLREIYQYAESKVGWPGSSKLLTPPQ